MTLDQLQKFCSAINHITDPNKYRRPFVYLGYIYATDRRICIRIPNDGSLDNDGDDARKRGVDYAALFNVSKNCDLPIPPLPNLIECDHCNGTALEHDCPLCDATGFGIDPDSLCKKCSGTKRIAPLSDAEPCWWCNGRGEQEYNPVEIGDTHLNRIYLAMAAEMPGARIVHIDGLNLVLIKFDGGEIAISPTKVKKKREG